VEQNIRKNITPNFEKLWVWQKAHKLALQISDVSKKLPHEERFRLKDQIERSSSSVPDNIAEAASSYYYNDQIKGYYVARKEAGETQNHIRKMEAKKYIPPTLAQGMIDEYEEVKRGINGLVKFVSQKRDTSKGQKGKH
jgi:four helix bundle protein